MKRYSLQLNILSPVHIGCGTDYNPLSYVIDTAHNELCSFTPQNLAEILNPDEFDQLDKISDMRGAGGLNAMSLFIGRYASDIRKASSHRVKTASGISKEYQEVLNGNAQRRGQIEIARTFYNPYTNTPIIPGSSIKGAIRTAVLSELNDGNEHPNKKNYNTDLLGGAFSEDPFRLIKIGDASQNSKEEGLHSKVVYAVNKYKAPNGNLLSGKGITVRLETIASMFENNRSYSSSLNLTKLGNVSGKIPKNDFHWKFSDLARMCNNFYRPKLESDLVTLGSHNKKFVAQVRQKILENESVASRLDLNNAFILRVGHHSGAESVTMDGARLIQIRRGRGNISYEKRSTTQWFTSDQHDGSAAMTPFGWLLVLIGQA